MEDINIEEMREQIQQLLQENKTDKLKALIEDIYPIDIALIIEKFSDEEILEMFSIINNEYMSKILEESDEEHQKRIVNIVALEDIIQLFSYMSKDDITDIMGILKIGVRKQLMKLMKKRDIEEIKNLLGYEKDSAGGIMTTEYLALKESLTITQAIEKIKTIGPETEIIETIFVLDDHKKLIGSVDLRDILTAKEGTTLSNIMNENIFSVTPDIDQEEVSHIVSKYDLEIIPVVNRKNSLIGVITIDDIIDVIVEENTEDILRLGGVSEEESVNTTLKTSIGKRLPWLFVNLITAFLAAFTVSLFETTIAQVVALAAAMPIVAGMGGNAGTQTLSIVIRSIALGEIEFEEQWKLIFKEISLGIINGAVLGVVTGFILYLKYGNPYLGLIIFGSMIANLVIAGLFGFSVPLLLKKVGVDPALASAIFLTTATDVFGFFIFLGLAQLFIQYLI